MIFAKIKGNVAEDFEKLSIFEISLSQGTTQIHLGNIFFHLDQRNVILKWD